MSSRQQIRAQARLLINQPDGTGDFTNDELNGFADEGVRFLAVLTKWPRDRIDVQVEQGKPAYTLVKDTLLINIAYFGDENVSGDKQQIMVLSEEQLSAKFPGWMDAVSTSQGRPRYACLIDKYTVAVYPTPNASESVSGKKLELVYVYYPGTMTAEGSEPAIPIIYHDLASQYVAHKCFMSKLNNPNLGISLLGDITNKAKLFQPVVTKEIEQESWTWGSSIRPEDW